MVEGSPGAFNASRDRTSAWTAAGTDPPDGSHSGAFGPGRPVAERPASPDSLGM
jgi:hypothetical protein